MDRSPRPLEVRFWAKVNKTDSCWLWTGTAPNGYGQIQVGEKMVPAHRVSYEMANGPIPVGKLVCHNCPDGDNPLCVNPAHLWLGTYAENSADMVRKGRTRPPCVTGEAHGSAVLTEAQVVEIRARYRLGNISHRALATIYGVSHRSIGSAINGQTWKHIKAGQPSLFETESAVIE
jgi:hypothetical protein